MDKLPTNSLFGLFGFDYENNDFITAKYGNPNSPNFDYEAYERDLNQKADEIIAAFKD